jgi:phosphoenolpyruvate phosphomutase
MRKTTKLKTMLQTDGLAYICEAHNGLSAKIVEESGFEGIWGSGLSLSAAMGVRDNNEASWTQVLDVLEFMTDATSIPILLDGDTGYGNFNNLRRLVRKLEQRDVAGVCIEDKLFPKTNSFIKGDAQPLADIEEFCGKIKAGKDTQRDDDFVIVARTEAFIAGWGLAEALKRAEAYYRAGADAILVHSKNSTPIDILQFTEAWEFDCPLVIVPTKYYSTPTEVFERVGISVVIWANHLLRSAITSMKVTATRLQRERTLIGIEEEIVPVKEIFRLQGAAELQQAEKRYLPKDLGETQVIVLAASKGKRLGSLTDDKPKCMVPINGEPLLSTLIRRFQDQGIKHVNVVTGYKPESVQALGVNTFNNADWEETGELGSLLCAEEKLTGKVVISYGDVLFRNYVLAGLLESERPITIVVDSSRKNFASHKDLDLTLASRPHQPSHFDTEYTLLKIDPKLNLDDAHGEWIGLINLDEAGTSIFHSAIQALRAEDPDYLKRSIADVLNFIIQTRRGEVAVQYTHGDWLDLDDVKDLVG